MESALSYVDWTVIGVYLAGVLLVGLYVSGRQESMRDYFLGGREIPWWAAMLSIVATETSAVTYIGYPGIAYGGDWGILQLILGFVAGRLFLAVFFIKAFYRADVVTVYGFLEQRFGNATRVIAALLFMAGRVIASGVRLFAACLAVRVATGLPIEWAIIGLGALGIGCTLAGGIRSVVWTDCILGITFIAGGVIAIGLLAAQIGAGPSAILSHLAEAGKLQVFHAGVEPAGGVPATWQAFLADSRPLAIGLAGGFVLTLATHGTDQDIVQRVLTCRDAGGGARSLIGSAVVIVPMTIIFLLAGSLLWMLYTTRPELAPHDLRNPNDLFPDYIVRHVPAGLAGLLLAGVFAAALSSLTSVLNALSSTAIADFYRPFLRRGRDERHYLRASRIATLLWGCVLVGVACAFIGSQENILRLALKVLAYFYGALLGSFLLGILTDRGSAWSTALGMIASFPVVLLLQLRAFLETPAEAPGLVRRWLEGLSPAASEAIRAWIPLLAWPLWIIAGTAVSLAIGALGRQTIIRRGS